MSQMNRPVGVRQGAGGQDLARGRGHAGYSGGERWPVKKPAQPVDETRLTTLIADEL
jgi:NADH:ubiquinone oxidoreductase subunit F (NADH-binding)